uniref:Uncharacterized protein n=1 Tax=Oryza sativa subsp. japonica TaxID=39947 RepID=Q5VME9_ORYSJ|nr:hypothetical protein [Oryza sativa Japonica Group]BAD69376.1 hypothetical protein [Oryza sativa Japonica Group]
MSGTANATSPAAGAGTPRSRLPPWTRHKTLVLLAGRRRWHAVVDAAQDAGVAPPCSRRPPPFPSGSPPPHRRPAVGPPCPGDLLPTAGRPEPHRGVRERERGGSERREEIEKRLTWHADMWGSRGSHADSAANKTWIKTA